MYYVYNYTIIQSVQVDTAQLLISLEHILYICLI